MVSEEIIAGTCLSCGKQLVHVVGERVYHPADVIDLADLCPALLPMEGTPYTSHDVPLSAFVPDAPTGLTEPEHRVVRMLGEVASVFCTEVVGLGGPRDHDVNEFIAGIHVLQRAVMGQAAARAHPELYRLLGETLRSAEPPF